MVGPLTSTYSYQRDILSDLKIGGLHFQQSVIKFQGLEEKEIIKDSRYAAKADLSRVILLSTYNLTQKNVLRVSSWNYERVK